MAALRFKVWGVGTALLSLLDWPLRRMTKGAAWMSSTLQVPSVPASYDKELAARLWDLSADAAKVPRNPAS